jgi:hypothetical protein
MGGVVTPTANRHSKVEGNAWEQVFKRAAILAGFATIHLPGGANPTGRRDAKGRPILFPVKMPFDFRLSKPLTPIVSEGMIYASAFSGSFDTKTIDGKTFPYSAITPHQLESLYSEECAGCCAGYIVYFRPENRVVFFSAGKLAAVRPRESLSPEDGLDLGSVYELKLLRLLESYERGKPYEQSKEESRQEVSLHQESWPGDDQNEDPQVK